MFGKNQIKSLSKKSAEILSLFTSTIEGLSRVNLDVAEEIDGRNDQIKQIEAEKTQLQNIYDENAKVIGKISKIFE